MHLQICCAGNSTQRSCQLIRIGPKKGFERDYLLPRPLPRPRRREDFFRVAKFASTMKFTVSSQVGNFFFLRGSSSLSPRSESVGVARDDDRELLTLSPLPFELLRGESAVDTSSISESLDLCCRPRA